MTCVPSLSSLNHLIKLTCTSYSLYDDCKVSQKSSGHDPYHASGQEGLHSNTLFSLYLCFLIALSKIISFWVLFFSPTKGIVKNRFEDVYLEHKQKWAGKMVQWIKAFATNPGNLISVSGTTMVKGEN